MDDVVPVTTEATPEAMAAAAAAAAAAEDPSLSAAALKTEVDEGTAGERLNVLINLVRKRHFKNPSAWPCFKTPGLPKAISCVTNFWYK